MCKWELHRTTHCDPFRTLKELESPSRQDKYVQEDSHPVIVLPLYICGFHPWRVRDNCSDAKDLVLLHHILISKKISTQY